MTPFIIFLQLGRNNVGNLGFSNANTCIDAKSTRKTLETKQNVQEASQNEDSQLLGSLIQPCSSPSINPGILGNIPPLQGHKP